MSLISAVNNEELNKSMSTGAASKSYSSRTSSISISGAHHNTTTKTTATAKGKREIISSVYQTSGEPLSKEALYRAKLKYGVYQSPSSGISIGVHDAKQASGSAAQTANGNEKKLTVEAYKRLIDPNAMLAVQNLAKSNFVAENINVPITETNVKGSKNAANKAFAVSMKQNDSRSEAHASKTYTLDSIASARSVITTKPIDTTFHEERVNPKAKPMDLSKLLQGAELKAERRIKERSNPERQNYTHGLMTKPADTTPLKFASDSSIMDSFHFAHSNANYAVGSTRAKSGSISSDSSLVKPRSRSSTLKSSYSAAVEEQEKLDLLKQQKNRKLAEDAANAAKDLDPKSLIHEDEDLAFKRKLRETYLGQLTSEQVLAMAKINADQKLQMIDNDLNVWNQKRLFSNEEYNKKAISIAQENLKNMPPPETRINLGGGLLLSNDEVSKIAATLISPVLNEVSERAEGQRATDVDIAERTLKHKNEMAELEAFHRSKLLNNQKITSATLIGHAQEKQSTKDSNAAKMNQLIATMDVFVANKNIELTTTEEELETLKVDMDKKVSDFEEHIKLELVNWSENRKLDLEEALEEQRVLLIPYQEDLKNAEEEHDNLIKERDDINTNIGSLNVSIEGHKAKITDLETEIEDQEAKQKEEDSKLQELNTGKDELASHISSIVIIKANKVKEETVLSTQQANLRQLEVDALVNERKSELNKVELDLKREKLNLMEALGKTAEIRGDEMDEEKLRSLIGITPSTENLLNEHAKSAIIGSNGLDTISEAAPSASAKSVTAVSGVIPSFESSNKHVTTSMISSPLSNNLAQAATETDKQKPEVSNSDEVKSTFSGFSQGTLPEEEEGGETPSVSSEKLETKDSYFKEVF